MRLNAISCTEKMRMAVPEGSGTAI